MTIRGGRYELLSTIAAGGMATVHLGRALGAGGFERLVAVKTMHPHLAREAEFVAMFLDEARLAARIRHPNVVATLDIQQDAEGLFLVMEYVEGPSLSRILKALAIAREQSPDSAALRLPFDVALRIFTDTLAGLHAAHELTGPDGEPLRLIHRDMSPHNVLVGADGITRITDFGVARAESRLATTRTGSVKGKVVYMAPEQVRSLPIDRRADIYAAGAVLWEMLTGERLVRAESDLAAMRMIVESDRQAPHEVDPSVPAEISAACMRALAREPEQRYPTAAAFAEAIEAAAAASGTTVAAPRTVAQYVRALGVHKSPDSEPLPRSRPAEATPASPAAAVSERSPAIAPASSSVASPVSTRVDAPPASVATQGAFTAQSPAAQPPRSRTGMFLMLGAAAVLGAVVAVIVIGRGPASGDAPGRAASAIPASGDSSPASVPSSTVQVEPAAPAPATAASAAPSTTSSASAPVRTAAPRPTAPANPKAFRPKEL